MEHDRWYAARLHERFDRPGRSEDGKSDDSLCRMRWAAAKWPERSGIRYTWWFLVQRSGQGHARLATARPPALCEGRWLDDQTPARPHGHDKRRWSFTRSEDTLRC